jgi:molybdenum cofactor cytidylyltransferase
MIPKILVIHVLNTHNSKSEIRNPKSMDDIWAIILAAGESKRMDSPKMLLPYKDKTIIETVIENVISSDVDKTMVVLGSTGDEILKSIKDLPLEHCFNDNYKEGMLSSVKCGFSNLPEKFEAVVVLPGDYPGIGADVINMLITSFRKSKKKIVIPLFRGKRGHPILISHYYRNEVMSLRQEEGLRALSASFQDDVLEVNMDDPAILRDIDTMEDYINELKQIT